MTKPLQPDQLRLTDALRQDRGRLEGFVRKRLGGLADQDPADVVSDVVLRLLERADLLAEVENITAYLFTALSNRIADLFRRKREAPMPEIELEPPPPPPLQGLQPEELRHDLLKAVDLLSSAERAVWLAVELEGWSFRELAERWNEPIGTLLSRKSRATQSLHRLMSE